MFYLIGLGLGDVDDITVKGLRIVKAAKRVYLEAYTSILTVDKQQLEEFYGREVILADRDMVEQDSESIMADADKEDIAFLVVGDPFGATTHSDLVLRAIQTGIKYSVIHNASIMNAVGCCGLQLYTFGETVSIVFWNDNWRPDSFYTKILDNRQRGLHTLCLLDIKVKEQSVENLIRGRKIFEPPRYMTVNVAVDQLLQIVDNKRTSGESSLAYDENTLCVGLARIGTVTQQIAVGTMKEMLSYDLGGPLHSLIIAGKTHYLENDMLKQFAINLSTFETLITT